MILTKEVEVRPRGKMIQHYRDKGYDAHYNESLVVNVEDLSRRSSIKVAVKCDYCGKETRKTYAAHSNAVDQFGYYACSKCRNIHQRKTFLEKYGCENITQIPEIREKQVKTLLEHYGVDSPLKNEEIKKKSIDTTIERFGVPNASQNSTIREKVARTMIERYGVPYSSQSPELREKAIETWKKNLGVDNPGKSIEVREKQVQSLYKNSSQKCSKQQLHIYNLYNTDGTAELNYPISYYNVDICFPAERLVIEYDGGGHNLNVVTGRITEAEFRRREIARDRTLKKEGYHLMRIISADDKLPSDDTLLQMLNHTREYFAAYPEHSWVEFDLDASTVRNAEHKDGSFFN